MPDVSQEPVQKSIGKRLILRSRAFVMFLVCALILLSLASPISEYFNQQQRISVLEQQISENKDTIATLQEQVDRWRDPNYVKAQAHSRLRYVMPGEIGYVVVEAKDAPVVVKFTSTKNSEAWYRVMWQSLKEAGTTAAPTDK